MNFLPARLFDWRVAVSFFVFLIASSSTVAYEPLLMLGLPYIVVTLGMLSSPFTKLLHGRDVSYGLYLYHIPIMQLVWVTGHSHLSIWQMLSLGSLATLLAASLSWIIVEKPALALKNRGRRAALRPEEGLQ